MCAWEDHAWDRSGQVSHIRHFCCCCAEGFAGGADLGIGRVNLEPPLPCREEHPELVPMAGGHGRDHGVPG